MKASNIQLNDLLAKKGIDPKGVLVLRHRPLERELRKILPWLAAERPDIYNGYQQAQRPVVEKAMTRAQYVASFIGHAPRQALFIGLYKNTGWRKVSFTQYWKIPQNIELNSLGMRGLGQERSSALWFDLKAVDFYRDWKGKLVVQWPGLERSWWRWSERNDFEIAAIFEESLLDAAMPSWEAIVLTWQELRVLPYRWRSALAQWRGVYFVFDVSSGRGYVGSASGNENILQRWLGYAATGHGGNKKLKNCRPANLRFSILQRVSPDMERKDVVQLEGSWKDRLHTRNSGLNDN